ncbi:MAG TPA: hypothetical protein VM187_06550, partial [Niastella sp.]|nr:hypothetical protein [Niastella sp.]
MQKIITAKERMRLACFLLLAICSMQSMAQVKKALLCREPKVSKEQMEKIINSRKVMNSQLMNGDFNALPLSTPQQIRVYFIICTDDNGSNAAATEAEAITEFQTMQADFAPGNICITLAGVKRLADTYLNHMDVDAEDDADDLFEARRIPGCLTIFLTAEIRGTNAASGGGYGGLAFNNPGTFCLVSNIGGHTSSHEAGHCLGLFHTFATKGFGLETISGSNCDMAGDLICDTKADPYAFQSAQDNCFWDNNGLYQGSCEDPEGHTNYDPPYKNIMSYWHHDPETFTGGQFVVMRNNIQDDDDVLTFVSANDYILYTATYNLENVYRSAINSFTTLGDVNFNLLSRAGLFGKVVILTPGFDAKPSAGGLTVIKANTCVGSASTFAPATLSRKAPSGKTELKVSNAPLSVYPNPTKGMVT